MASCNFIGLVKIYGEDVLQYIKGCEFHFRDSVNRHANKFGDESETFKKYALQLLTSSTPEAYEISCQQLKSFINTTANTETCHHWLNWWNSRKEFIFCSFTSKEARSSNLAEIIHAGWKHRERMGVGLVEVCLFDTLDSLLFESQIEGLATGFFQGGDGPCQGKLSSAREEKDILLAEDIGRDFLDFGNRITSPENKKKLFTKANEDCNSPKRKKNDRYMLEKRIETVKAHAGNIKVTNTTILLKGSTILLVVRQEELVMLPRFVAPPHLLVLIFGKMVRRFFANTYLF